MTAAQAITVVRGALREVREAVRTNNTEKAMTILRGLDHALVRLEQKFARELGPVAAPLSSAVQALGQLAGALDALGRVAARRR